MTFIVHTVYMVIGSSCNTTKKNGEYDVKFLLLVHMGACIPDLCWGYWLFIYPVLELHNLAVLYHNLSWMLCAPHV